MSLIKVGSVVKVNHPATVFNPTEYFEVIDIQYNTISQTASIRGKDTCWFGVGMILDVMETQ